MQIKKKKFSLNKKTRERIELCMSILIALGVAGLYLYFFITGKNEIILTNIGRIVLLFLAVSVALIWIYLGETKEERIYRSIFPIIVFIHGAFRFFTGK